MQGVSKYPCTELRACIGKTRHRRLEYPNSQILNSKMYLNVKMVSGCVTTDSCSEWSKIGGKESCSG